jgi:hypothetical protein
MAAFRGDVSEYREFGPGRWRREDKAGNWIEEDGITTLSDGVTFAEIYDRRANPPPPEPDSRDAKIAALEARIGKVEAETIAARKLQKD